MRGTGRVGAVTRAAQAHWRSAPAWRRGWRLIRTARTQRGRIRWGLAGRCCWWWRWQPLPRRSRSITAASAEAPLDVHAQQSSIDDSARRLVQGHRARAAACRPDPRGAAVLARAGHADGRRRQAAGRRVRDRARPDPARTAAADGRRRGDPAPLHDRRGLELPRTARRAGRGQRPRCRRWPTCPTRTLAQRLGIADGQPEGWFLPETYAWVTGESDLDVLAARARGDATRRWTTPGPRARPRLPLKSPYQALILASIVEKETGAAQRAAADRRRVRAPPARSACACRPTRP